MRTHSFGLVVIHCAVGCAALSACGSANISEAPASSGGATQTVGTGGKAAGANQGGTFSESGTASGSSGDGAGGSSASEPVTGGAGAGGAGAGGAGAGGGVTNTGGSPNAADVTIVPDPSWTCGKPEGIVAPTRGKLVLSATLQLGDTHEVGATQFGHRRVRDVKSGTLTGKDLKGVVLSGGLELELQLSNGSTELEQLHVARAADGTLIYLRSCGVTPTGETVTRIVPQLEVSRTSALAWLNDAKLVGTRSVDSGSGIVELAIYDVAEVAIAEPKTQLRDPPGEPQQTWECVVDQGTQGASVFTETVTLGASLSVGQGSNGARNIIPITGGTVSGRLQGKVLPGGADYQLISGSTQLDARYTLAASDGELVVVRNCGAFGALIPVFEARAAGPYAFLNVNAFSSSNPGSASGGVSITFYERK